MFNYLFKTSMWQLTRVPTCDNTILSKKKKKLLISNSFLILREAKEYNIDFTIMCVFYYDFGVCVQAILNRLIYFDRSN